MSIEERTEILRIFTELEDFDFIREMSSEQLWKLMLMAFMVLDVVRNEMGGITMTIDEAIKHAEEEAKEQDKLCKRYDDASGYTRSHNEDIRSTNAKKCAKCAEEHRQLAEWLKELKLLREQTRWIPVSERLPEVGISVLTRDGVFFDEWGNKIKGIVAWMPLPKPYDPQERSE